MFVHLYVAIILFVMIFLYCRTFYQVVQYCTYVVQVLYICTTNNFKNNGNYKSVYTIIKEKS